MNSYAVPDAILRIAICATVPSLRRCCSALKASAVCAIQPSVPLPDFSVEVKISTIVLLAPVCGLETIGKVSIGGRLGARSEAVASTGATWVTISSRTSTLVSFSFRSSKASACDITAGPRAAWNCG